MTYLCAAIFVRDPAQARRDIAQALEAGADMIELRLDAYDSVPEIQQLIASFDNEFILTCRAEYEGGESGRTDEDRAEFLCSIAPNNRRVSIDLEYQALPRIARQTFPNRLIVSSHDFKNRPPTLSRTFNDMLASTADVAKTAWMARSVRDNVEAFELLSSRNKPAIALCMGEAGLISRVLAKKFGAFLTFASLRDESATAPGQVTLNDMKRLYRWDALGANTKTFGVVASPVAHSMSPAIHNAAFAATGEDAVYLPFLVQAGYESFKAFMEEFARYTPLHLRGLSVTLPHKENALRYLKEIGGDVEPLAEQIGAVNTITIDRDSANNPILRGRNTDYRAIVDTICTALAIEESALKNYRVAVIGAGGTGRTAVAALAALGATVVIYNRTRDRANTLAEDFTGRTGKVVAADIGKLCDSCCQVYINTTSLGMHPNIDTSPFGDAQVPKFTPDTLVFDTVYNPPLTKLLRQAEQAGAKTVGGIEMFVRQAAAQFTEWTGREAPVQVMREVVVSRLGSK